MMKLSIRKILDVTLIVLVVCIGLLAYCFTNCYQANRLVDAIEQGYLPSVERIVDKYPHCVNMYTSVSPHWWLAVMGIAADYPLEAACRAGEAAAIRYLVEHGADVNCDDGSTPLSITLLVKPGEPTFHPC